MKRGSCFLFCSGSWANSEQPLHFTSSATFSYRDDEASTIVKKTPPARGISGTEAVRPQIPDARSPLEHGPCTNTKNRPGVAKSVAGHGNDTWWVGFIGVHRPLPWPLPLPTAEDATGLPPSPESAATNARPTIVDADPPLTDPGLVSRIPLLRRGSTSLGSRTLKQRRLDPGSFWAAGDRPYPCPLALHCDLGRSTRF